MKPLTYQQVEEQGLYCYSYDKNRWKYKKDDIEYLVYLIDGTPKIVAKGDFVFSYDLHRWEYTNNGVRRTVTLQEFLVKK